MEQSIISVSALVALVLSDVDRQSISRKSDSRDVTFTTKAGKIGDRTKVESMTLFGDFSYESKENSD